MHDDPDFRRCVGICCFDGIEDVVELGVDVGEHEDRDVVLGVVLGVDDCAAPFCGVCRSDVEFLEALCDVFVADCDGAGHICVGVAVVFLDVEHP